MYRLTLAEQDSTEVVRGMIRMSIAIALLGHIEADCAAGDCLLYFSLGNQSIRSDCISKFTDAAPPNEANVMVPFANR
jgi:hypothetical protein